LSKPLHRLPASQALAATPSTVGYFANAPAANDMRINRGQAAARAARNRAFHAKSEISCS
jgi:hypothetical protein